MKTEKFIPVEKQSKKARKEAAKAKRGSWGGIKPVTKVIPHTKAEKLKKLKEKEAKDHI